MREFRTVLVDDSQVLLDVLTSSVNHRHGIRVAGMAKSGAAAKPLVDRLQPDLVLLDFRLQDCSAVDLIRALKAATPAPRVVVVSNHDETEYRQASVAAGADGYLVKTEIPTELPALLTRFSQ